MGAMKITDTKQSDTLFTCPECGLTYNEKTWAEKCEAWCKEHESCNLDVIKHAID